MRTSKFLRTFVIESSNLWKHISLQSYPIFSIPFEGSEANVFGTQNMSHTEKFLEFLIKNKIAPNVVELDLTRCHIPSSILVKLFWIADNFPNLERLSLPIDRKDSLLKLLGIQHKLTEEV